LARQNPRTPLSWINIPRDDTAFMEFVAEVLTTLEASTPPMANPNCGWCRYSMLGQSA
jgi:hypothetical protein